MKTTTAFPAIAGAVVLAVAGWSNGQGSSTAPASSEGKAATQKAYDLAERAAAYKPYDGSGRYTMEKDDGIRSIQGLYELSRRFGFKPYKELSQGQGNLPAWQTERVCYRDVDTGAATMRMTSNFGADELSYFQGNWSADGRTIIWQRRPESLPNLRRNPGLCRSDFLYVFLVLFGTEFAGVCISILLVGLRKGWLETRGRNMTASIVSDGRPVKVVSVTLLAGLVATMLATSAQAVPKYALIDLYTLGQGGSVAYGINDSGQVVGTVLPSSGGAYRGFVFSHSTMTELGTLGGISSAAEAINAGGTVVGYSATATGSNHAFRRDGTTMTDLGTLGGAQSDAYAMNDNGQVVGTSYPAGATRGHAFFYRSTMIDLGTLGGPESIAYGINAAGTVVGFSYLPGNYTVHAFRWDGTTMTDLGTLGGSMSRAYAINDCGLIVGIARTKNDMAYRAFLYNGTTMTDLGVLSGGSYSSALGINDNGQVVGWSNVTGTSNNHAFLYTGGKMYDLNNLVRPGSGWTLTEAAGINNAAQIVGQGTAPDGKTHGFLLAAERPGDANSDGKVDGGDLALWQQNYDPLGLHNNTFAMGDWNDDGKIDGGDLALWQQNYAPLGYLELPGAEPLQSLSDVSSVPEPATMFLLTLGATALLLRPRRRLGG